MWDPVGMVAATPGSSLPTPPQRDPAWYRGQSLYSLSYRHAHPPRPLLVTPIQPKAVAAITTNRPPRQRPYPPRRRPVATATASFRRSATARQPHHHHHQHTSAAMGGLVTRGVMKHQQHHVKSDGNGNIERVEKRSGGSLAAAAGPRLPLPPQLDLALDRPVAGREEQGRHAWNPEDRSLNIFVKEEDELTFHRLDGRTSKRITEGSVQCILYTQCTVYGSIYISYTSFDKSRGKVTTQVLVPHSNKSNI